MFINRKLDPRHYKYNKKNYILTIFHKFYCFQQLKKKEIIKLNNEKHQTHQLINTNFSLDTTISRTPKYFFIKKAKNKNFINST